MGAAALALVDEGLVRMGAAQKDLRPRFFNFAADFFRQLAQGEKPAKPDKFVAEIAAEMIAESVGAEVPMPLEDVAAAKRLAAGKPLPTDVVTEAPEAGTWLLASGFGGGRKPSSAARMVLSALLTAPKVEWKAGAIASRIRKTRSSVTRLLIEFRKHGLVTSEGVKTGCRWRLAEMPPHV